MAKRIASASRRTSETRRSNTTRARDASSSGKASTTRAPAVQFTDAPAFSTGTKASTGDAYEPNTFQTINPMTQVASAHFERLTDSQLSLKVDAANQAQRAWAAMSVKARGQVMHRVADTLRANADEIAGLMADEMGKPLAEGRAEIKKWADGVDYFATHAPSMLASQRITDAQGTVEIRKEPTGTLFSILPWNMPIGQIFRMAGPALMGGNAVLMKHAPNVPQTAQRVEQLMLEAGVPKGVFTNLFIDLKQAQALIADPRVAGVTLTGSERAGRAIAEAAGKVMKPYVTELGGADPFVVLADANLERAVETLVSSRTMNAGQMCIAPKRIILEAPIHDRFVSMLVERLKRVRIGDPKDPQTQMGPMARADLHDELVRQVELSKKQGARAIVAGTVPEGHPTFFAPTVLLGVETDNVAFQEELFGPVFAITKAKNVDHACTLANLSRFGLGAAVWTENHDHAETFFNQVTAGLKAWNGPVESRFAAPIGGRRASGFGAELGTAGLWVRETTHLLPT